MRVNTNYSTVIIFFNNATAKCMNDAIFSKVAAIHFGAAAFTFLSPERDAGATPSSFNTGCGETRWLALEPWACLNNQYVQHSDYSFKTLADFNK